MVLPPALSAMRQTNQARAEAAEAADERNLFRFCIEGELIGLDLQRALLGTEGFHRLLLALLLKIAAIHRPS